MKFGAKYLCGHACERSSVQLISIRKRKRRNIIGNQFHLNFRVNGITRKNNYFSNIVIGNNKFCNYYKNTRHLVRNRSHKDHKIIVSGTSFVIISARMVHGKPRADLLRAFWEPDWVLRSPLRVLYIQGALQEERFCASSTRKPPSGPSKNLLKTRLGS